MTESEKAEAYKKKQEEIMESLVVGARSPSGEIIKKVFTKGDEYIVYEIKTNNIADSIKVYIHSKIESDKELEYKFGLIREKYTKLKGLLYKVVDDNSLKARIAHIITHGLKVNHNEANALFVDLIEEINTEYKNQFNHRILYLFTITFIVLLCISASILEHIKGFLNIYPVLKPLVYVSTAGCLGGFVSITRKLKSMLFEKDVSWYLYILFGVERMIIGIFGGVVIYFAIKCDLIFGFINGISKPLYGYILFAVVAGFSETLIPNLLIKLEKDDKE